MTDEASAAILRAIETLSADMSGVKADISGIKSDISGIKSDISGMKSDISGMKVDIVGVRADISALNSRLSALEADMLAMKADISEIKHDVFAGRSELAGLRIEVMSRMDRLQDKLSAVTDDITVNFAAAMKSDRVAKNTLEETRALSDELAALRLQVRRISAKVFGPDELH